MNSRTESVDHCRTSTLTTAGFVGTGGARSNPNCPSGLKSFTKIYNDECTQPVRYGNSWKFSILKPLRVLTLSSWKFWKIRDDVDVDGQLVAPEPRLIPDARRRQNHFEFCKIFMTIVSTHSMGYDIVPLEHLRGGLCALAWRFRNPKHKKIWQS